VRRLLLGLLVFSLGVAAAWGKAKEVDDYHWQGIERIVAIGDLHGDYEQYREVLRDAGLINSRGKWDGGDAHLVQTGDITDRGPDSIAIIDHLQDLKKQARRKGGRVHTLIGNHEAMNSYGDLRYVHQGEFEFFVDRGSAALRERQWDYTLQQLEARRPEEFQALDLELYRLEWEKQFPLGWVEHRTAWLPSGEYGQWVLENPVAIKLNDTIFLHGGLSEKYCHMSLAELTERAHAELQNFNPETQGMIEDPEGPLWYRGLAQDSEELMGPVVEAIMARYEAERIVVGHTPTGGVVWPRFDGRVVANDTGIAKYYGGHAAFLEINGEGALAGYGERRLALPAASDQREVYLREVIALNPANPQLQRRLALLLEPPPPGAEVEPMAELDEPREPGRETLSPDICR
jgi:hypothetical protein